MAEKEAAMKAAKAGELALLKNHLEGLDVPAYADLEDGLNQNHLIIAAAENGHMEVIDWLLNERFPDYTPHLHSHLAAIQGGPKVYDVFITKWPYLLEMELSHSGNPLGLSILGNRKDLVKFILEKGVDPNTAEFNHHSVSWCNLFKYLCVRVFSKYVACLVLRI